jgi:hypothetical protein
MSSLVLGLGVQPAAAKPNKVVGAACSKVGAQATVVAKGKKTTKPLRLLCVITVDGLRWGVHNEIPSKPLDARKLAQRLGESPEPPAIAEIRNVTLSSRESIEQELAVAIGARDEWAAKLNQVRARVAELQVEQQNLPSQLATATQANQNAKTSHDNLAEVAKRESSTLSSMYAEYSAAQDSIYAALAPGIMCNFGFTEFCAQYAAYEAQRPWANAVTARYEAQKAKADAAFAAVSSAYRNWEAKYAEYKRLFDRQSTLPTELAAAIADVNHATGMDSNATGNANMFNERVQLFEPMMQKVQLYDAMKAELSKLIAEIAIGAPGWQQRLRIIAQKDESLKVSQKILTDLWVRYAT